MERHAHESGIGQPVPAVTNPERLAQLYQLALLDTPAERSFDRLTWLATQTLNVPVALVSLVDQDRQFFKSCIGLPQPWSDRRETPLSHSFCQHVVSSGEPLIIVDARRHPLTKGNLAIRDLGVIAYIGFPLTTPDGYVMGSFCAIDHQPRHWTEHEIAILQELSASVMSELDLRREVAARQQAEAALQRVNADLEQRVAERTAALRNANIRLQTELVHRRRAEEAVRASEERFRGLIQHSSDLITVLEPDGTIAFESPAITTILGYGEDELIGKSAFSLIHPDDRHRVMNSLAEALEAPENPLTLEFRFLHRDGTWRDLEAIGCNLLDNRAICGIVTNSRDITERKQAERELEQIYEQLREAYDATLLGWARFLELRDKETEGHTQRVTAMTVRQAAAIGFAGEELEHIRRGALLHDLGKMGIPDHILLKQGPLTEEEWSIMRLHPVYAYQLLRPIAFLQPALAIPYCHHEKWDGTGYPQGLQGEQIPLAARIFAIVDVWDALASDRPYRKALPSRQIRQRLREGAGTHFDPNLVEVFLDVMEQDPAPGDPACQSAPPEHQP